MNINCLGWLLNPPGRLQPAGDRDPVRGQQRAGAGRGQLPEAAAPAESREGRGEEGEAGDGAQVREEVRPVPADPGAATKVCQPQPAESVAVPSPAVVTGQRMRSWLYSRKTKYMHLKNLFLLG